MSLNQHDVPHATNTNRLPCPEIRAYRAIVADGRYIVTYEERQPGAATWQPVRLSRVARPEDRPTA